MLTAHAEMTDTYGSESNYSWVKRRSDITAKTERGLIKKVKSEFGLTGIKCRKYDFGDMIQLNPRNMNIVVFINF